MAKDISIAQQVFNILEDAGRPLFLREIVKVLGEDFDSMYVQPSVSNLVKSQLINSKIKLVPAIKGKKRLKFYFINGLDQVYK